VCRPSCLKRCELICELVLGSPCNAIARNAHVMCVTARRRSAVTIVATAVEPLFVQQECLRIRGNH